MRDTAFRRGGTGGPGQLLRATRTSLLPHALGHEIHDLFTVAGLTWLFARSLAAGGSDASA
jgi:hypothetical protein